MLFSKSIACAVVRRHVVIVSLRVSRTRKAAVAGAQASELAAPQVVVVVFIPGYPDTPKNTASASISPAATDRPSVRQSVIYLYSHDEVPVQGGAPLREEAVRGREDQEEVPGPSARESECWVLLLFAP